MTPSYPQGIELKTGGVPVNPMKVSQSSVLFLTLLLVALSGVAYADQFLVSADGQEVADPSTGLVWRRCPEGMVYKNDTCTGSAGMFTHEGALQHTAAQGGGWRLPTLKELLSMTKRTLTNVKVDAVAFPATPQGKFWTASPDGKPNYHLSTH